MKKILVMSVMALGLVMISPPAHAVIPGMGIEIGAGLEHTSRDWKRAGFKGESTTLGFFVEPTVELMEGLDVYLKLGMARIEAKSTGVVFDGGMDFGWGLGARYIMPMNGLGGRGRGIGEALKVGVGFEYISLSSDHKAKHGHPAGPIDKKGWKLSLFASEDMGMAVPYMGLRYSDMKLEVARRKYDADRRFGIFLGADIPMDFANINFEVGLLDETSFKIGASFVF